MKIKFIILIITFVALGLRVYNIEQKNLWFDEIYSWKITQGDFIKIISQTSGDIHPPFYYIVLKLWIDIFSDTIFSMRMLSVLLSILCIYFIYKISDLFIKDVFQISLIILLYALSPLNIYYSQEVRMQNLNLLLCLGSVYYLFGVLKIPSKKNGVLYLCFTVFSLYTHYFAFLIFFTEILVVALFYLYKRIDIKIIKKYSLYFLIINLLYAPWYPVLFNQATKGQPWRTPQNFIQVINSIFNYFKDVYLSIYFITENEFLKYFTTFFILFVIIFLILSFLKTFKAKTFFPTEANAISLFVLVPLLGATIISFNQSIAISRYLSIILPFLFISLVYFSFKLYKKIIAVTFLLILLVISCYGTYINFNSNFKNNDYRKMISYLEAQYKDGDEIIIEPHYMSWIFEYYISHSDTKLKYPKVLGWNLDMQTDSLHNTLDIKNFWLVLDYSSLDKNNYDFRTNILNSIGYTKVNSNVFYTISSKVIIEYYKKNI